MKALIVSLSLLFSVAVISPSAFAMSAPTTHMTVKSVFGDEKGKKKCCKGEKKECSKEEKAKCDSEKKACCKGKK